VHVVGVPVVGRGDRDDASQARWSTGGDLQRVEPAPGDAHHPGRAVAPRLLGQPGQYLLGVTELTLEVLVGEHALGVAAPPQVDPHAGVAVTGEVGMVDRVPFGRQVAASVGDHLQDSGDRLLVGGHRTPDPGGEPGAVVDGDPHRRVLADLVGQVGDLTHPPHLPAR
jgi:hypothetical protein